MIQYRSKRLGEEFIDYESACRERGKRYHMQCSYCKQSVTIVSISFGAGFCSPGCYIKYNQDFNDWWERQVLERGVYEDAKMERL